ncbi:MULTISPECIES: hypothetical protein [Peribacillus]|nr:hypothetical protein [Peribacillus frigoritolerans]
MNNTEEAISGSKSRTILKENQKGEIRCRKKRFRIINETKTIIG